MSHQRSHNTRFKTEAKRSKHQQKRFPFTEGKTYKDLIVSQVLEKLQNQ